MRTKWIKDIDFINYKKPSLFIGACGCDWKCCKEQNVDNSICWNNELFGLQITDISPDKLYEKYANNSDTSAIVIGGFEPLLQFNEVLEVIAYFRSNGCEDDFVIYTGYYPHEIKKEIEILKQYPNIVVKFGRFLIDDKTRYDDVLGLILSSSNQYAIKIS